MAMARHGLPKKPTLYHCHVSAETFSARERSGCKCLVRGPQRSSQRRGPPSAQRGKPDLRLTARRSPLGANSRPDWAYRYRPLSGASNTMGILTSTDP